MRNAYEQDLTSRLHLVCHFLSIHSERTATIAVKYCCCRAKSDSNQLGQSSGNNVSDWGAKVTHSMMTNYELAWGYKFWQVWLGDGSDATVQLFNAVTAAEAYHPGVTNDFKLTIYGNKDLTWGE